MKKFLTFAFSGGENIITSIVTTIAFLFGVVLPFIIQLTTDSDGWEMIAFGSLLTIVIYFMIFGLKSWVPYVVTVVIGGLSFILFWLAFLPAFFMSIGILYWYNTYLDYQTSLLPPLTGEPPVATT